MMPQMCRFCFNLDGSPIEFSTIDDQNTHAQAHLFQLGYISGGNRPDLKQISDRCFPAQTIDDIQNEDTVHLDSENAKSRSILFKRCLRVFNNRKNKTDPLICRECGKSVRYIKGRSQIDTYSILEHACSHLDKKQYGCRHCDYKVSRNGNIYMHLKGVHKISPTKNKDILERWAADFDAIVAILNKCYDGFEGNSKKTSQDLLVERKRIYSTYIKKFIDKDKKIECQLCQKAVLICKRRSDCQPAMKHMLTHLKKPIFKCTKCSSAFTSHFAANDHAKRQHKSSIAEIMEDRLDKSRGHHGYVVEMLQQERGGLRFFVIPICLFVIVRGGMLHFLMMTDS